MSGFTKQSTKAPVKGKPHIYMREGWWRVSPRSGHGIESWKRWHRAYRYAYLKNEAIIVAFHVGPQK